MRLFSRINYTLRFLVSLADGSFTPDIFSALGKNLIKEIFREIAFSLTGKHAQPRGLKQQEIVGRVRGCFLIAGDCRRAEQQRYEALIQAEEYAPFVEDKEQRAKIYTRLAMYAGPEYKRIEKRVTDSFLNTVKEMSCGEAAVQDKTARDLLDKINICGFFTSKIDICSPAYGRVEAQRQRFLEEYHGNLNKPRENRLG